MWVVALYGFIMDRFIVKMGRNFVFPKNSEFYYVLNILFFDEILIKKNIKQLCQGNLKNANNIFNKIPISS